MEIVQWRFAIHMEIILFLCSETAGYEANRIRKELQTLEDDIYFIRKDITILFDKTYQLNISATGGCGICISGNKTSYQPVMNNDGRKDIAKVDGTNVFVKYHSLIKAFDTEKRINRELQDQLKSMEDIISDIYKNITLMNIAKEMVGNERDRELQNRLRSIEDIISVSESVTNERYRKVQGQLQSVEKTISNIAQNLRKRITLKKRNDRVAIERDGELQRRFQLVENTISANEKVAKERDRGLQSRLRSVEDIIARSEKVANERDRELQNRLQSIEESMERSTADIYRDIRNNMTSFMTMITDRLDEVLLKAETASVKSDITTVPIIDTACTAVPESGVYTLHLQVIMSPVTVYCDQDTDGGGWIVFMRRQDGSVNFFRSWLDYKLGFGSPYGEFWAGNEFLYKLTKERPLQLRIDMENFDGNTAFAMYKEFQVGAEEDKYRLHVSGYSGDAGDSLIDTTHSRHKLTGIQFSTFDSDNDRYFHECAKASKGGWWYNNCFAANLNGPYSHDKYITWAKGIIWESWKGYGEALKRVEMKIR